MTQLAWIKDWPSEGAETAVSGNLPIGCIGKAADGWYWKIDAVYMRDIRRKASGRGLKTSTSARASVSRGWAAWRKAAGL